MRQYAVLGSPIKHSKSPLIHNAVFQELRDDAQYSSIEISEGLKTWLHDQGPEWVGFSVTMPLKKQALDAANRADPLAIATQAANTLVRTQGGWDAYNTDVFGIQQALRGNKFSSVCILGTGATARSAIVAMLDMGKRVILWGRNQEAVQKLCTEFDLESVASLHIALSQPAVISTLPANALDDQISGSYNGVLLDVVYDPWPTKLALAFDVEKVVSGLEMLIWQALGQQRLFHGLDLDETLPNEAKLLEAIRLALSVPK